MLLEIYVFFQVVVIVLFATAFFTKQEIIWALSIIFSAVLMASSWFIEYSVYEYNATVGAYVPVFVSESYPYLSGINFVFFALGLTLMMFDLFEKYGNKFAKGVGEKVKKENDRLQK